MRDHYVIVEIDAKGRVSTVQIRIQDSFYSCDVHDNGAGARKLFLHIDHSRPVQAPGNAPTGREGDLVQAVESLKRQFSR